MKENFYPELEILPDSKQVDFIHVSKHVPPYIFNLWQWLMHGCRDAHGVSRQTQPRSRPITLCLRLLWKCHGTIAKASGHLQSHDIQPKVRSFASAWTWQGGSAQAQHWLGWSQVAITALQSGFWERPLAWGQCREQAAQLGLSLCWCWAFTSARKAWAAQERMRWQQFTSVVLWRLPDFSHSLTLQER